MPMPTLADIDDPRPSRVRGFAVGAAIAVPIGAVFLWFAIGVLPQLILDSAVEYDARLRQEDAYMQSLCANISKQTIDRDEQLCECVLAVEYPALDCRAPFMDWSLERMDERCADEATHQEALSFCSCVDAIGDQLEGLDRESKEAREIIQRYENCTALDDALYLPELTELVPDA